MLRHPFRLEISAGCLKFWGMLKKWPAEFSLDNFPPNFDIVRVGWSVRHVWENLFWRRYVGGKIGHMTPHFVNTLVRWEKLHNSILGRSGTILGSQIMKKESRMQAQSSVGATGCPDRRIRNPAPGCQHDNFFNVKLYDRGASYINFWDSGFARVLPKYRFSC